MDTITITFPKVKVNTEIKDLTFDSLEDMIFEISQNIACRVFEKALTDRKFSFQSFLLPGGSRGNKTPNRWSPLP